MNPVVHREFSKVDGIVSDEPMAMRALQRIEDHIDACATNYNVMTATFLEVKAAIKETNKLLMSFIGFVIVTVIGFASYTYVQNQTLAEQLAASHLAAATAVQQIPTKTADAVAARLPPKDTNFGN